MKHYFVNCFWQSFLGFTVNENNVCIKTYNFGGSFNEKFVGKTYDEIDHIFKTRLPHYKIGGEALLLTFKKLSNDIKRI